MTQATLLILAHAFLWHWTTRAWRAQGRRTWPLAVLVLGLMGASILGMNGPGLVPHAAAGAAALVLFWLFVRAYAREAGSFWAHRRNERVTMVALGVGTASACALGAPGALAPLAFAFLVAHVSWRHLERRCAGACSDLEAARAKILAKDAESRRDDVMNDFAARRVAVPMIGRGPRPADERERATPWAS